MNFLRRFLRPEDGFIDIGANVGFYSIFASTLVSPCNIHAVEALPRNVEVLRKQMEINHLDTVNIYPIALSSATGVVRFISEERETGAISIGADGIEVKAYTMDDLLGERIRGGVNVAKMDVEGSELAVLTGAEGLLARGVVPVWLFEFAPANLERAGASGRDLLNVFMHHGYRFYSWDEDKLLLTECDPQGGSAQNYLACSSPELLASRLNVPLP